MHTPSRHSTPANLGTVEPFPSASARPPGSALLPGLLAALAACCAAVPLAARAEDRKSAAPADTVFDLKSILASPLNARTLKRTEKDGIVTEEVRFHSEKDGEKDVEIFAYFSYPDGAKNLPAFVWNQGGLGKASTYWTEFGARRGYAALCIDFPLPGYRSTGSYPIVSGLDLPADPRQAPIYHGAVALLRAVSFLQARPEVDPDRIGMAGSSWGGFYTTLMAGVDPRLKACSSMFGCGALELGNVWWDGRGPDPARDRAFRERWRTTLDPAWRLPQARAAVAWFSGTNDNFYWLPALDETFRRARTRKHLSLLPNWDHALTAPLDEQVFAWLDVHLKGARPFLHVGELEVTEEGGGQVVRWSCDGPRRPTAAELLVSFGEAGNWRGRYWHVLPATVRGQECRAELPACGLPCFASGTVTDGDGFRYSTALLPRAAIAKALAQPPDYDGCSMWGGFGEAEVSYLRRQGLPVPALTDGSKPGSRAAVLSPGKTTLPPMLCTAGVAHRFSCRLRAEPAAAVKIQLSAPAGAGQATASREVRVGADWTDLDLDLQLPAATSGPVRATLVVPQGTAARAEGVSFRPVRAGQ